MPFHVSVGDAEEADVAPQCGADKVWYSVAPRLWAKCGSSSTLFNPVPAATILHFYTDRLQDGYCNIHFYTAAAATSKAAALLCSFFSLNSYSQDFCATLINFYTGW